MYGCFWDHVMILIIISLLYGPLGASSYKLTIGLTFTHSQTEVKEHPTSLMVMCDSITYPPVVVGLIDQYYDYKLSIYSHSSLY